MAEFGTAAIGAGAALGVAAYAATTGFVARHESVHSAGNDPTPLNRL
jgi:hypothetical protein